MIPPPAGLALAMREARPLRTVGFSFEPGVDVERDTGRCPRRAPPALTLLHDVPGLVGYVLLLARARIGSPSPGCSRARGGGKATASCSAL